MKEHPRLPLTTYFERPAAEMQARANKVADRMHLRRSVRDFSNRSIPRDIIENVIRAAGQWRRRLRTTLPSSTMSPR